MDEKELTLLNDVMKLRKKHPFLKVRNSEYSEYQWVGLNELNEFEPKIPTIPKVIKELLRLEKIAEEKEFVII